MSTTNSREISRKRRDDYIDWSQFLTSEALQNLTPEELSEVSRDLRQFQDYRYHPDVGDSLLRAVAAAALCNYALRLIREAVDPDSETNESTVALSDKGIWATRRAIDLYPHPVLFGRLANFLDAAGWRDEASKIRGIQQKQQSTWVEKQSDELLMIRLDHDTWLETP